MSSPSRIKEDAAALGFQLKRVKHGDRYEARWSCLCVKCGKEQTWGWDPQTSPHFMVQNAKSAGWEQDRRGMVCDACVQSETSKRRKMSKVENIPNPKLQRKVFALLDDHFDEDKRLYRAGWSDKKVADEAQTSEMFVATLRKGAYGELAEDPAVTALRAEMEELTKVAKMIEDDLLNRMAEISQKITQLHERINSYELKRVA